MKTTAAQRDKLRFLMENVPEPVLRRAFGLEPGTGAFNNWRNGGSISATKARILEDLYKIHSARQPSLPFNANGGKDWPEAERSERAARQHKVLEALLADGWSEESLARAIGYDTVSGLRLFRHNPLQAMHKSKHRAMEYIYERRNGK